MEVLLIIILNILFLANAQSNSGIWQSGKGVSDYWNSDTWRSGAGYSSNRNSYISIVKSNPFYTMSRAYSIVLSAPQTTFSNHNSYISIVKSNPFITTSRAYSIVSTTPTVAPTLEPTIIPTLVPTLIPYSNPKTIIFETTTTLSGFPTASLSDQEQTIYIVAFSSSIHIDSEMVKIVKQEIANRRLTYNIDVTARITYPYVSDPQTSYIILVQQILGKGTNFTSLLKSVALKMGVESFKNVSVIGVQVSPLLNNDEEISAITPRHQVGTLLIVIMTISASSVVVAFFVYLYKKKWSRINRSRNFERILNLRRMSEYFTNERSINEDSINEVWGIESCVIEDSFTEICVTGGPIIEICITEGCVTEGCVTGGPASNSIQSIVD